MAATASQYTIDYANFSEGSDFLKNFGQGGGE